MAHESAVLEVVEVADAADAAARDGALSGALEGVLDAYRQGGYSVGYRRAVSDLLAEFLLISESYLHDRPQPPDRPGGLRELLRSFEHHLEQFARVRLESDVSFEGGLGI
jgi:hypothetical protein